MEDRYGEDPYYDDSGYSSNYDPYSSRKGCGNDRCESECCPPRCPPKCPPKRKKKCKCKIVREIRQICEPGCHIIYVPKKAATVRIRASGAGGAGGEAEATSGGGGAGGFVELLIDLCKLRTDKIKIIIGAGGCTVANMMGDGEETVVLAYKNYSEIEIARCAGGLQSDGFQGGEGGLGIVQPNIKGLSGFFVKGDAGGNVTEIDVIQFPGNGGSNPLGTGGYGGLDQFAKNGIFGGGGAGQGRGTGKGEGGDGVAYIEFTI